MILDIRYTYFTAILSILDIIYDLRVCFVARDAKRHENGTSSWMSQLEMMNPINSDGL